MDVFS